MKRSLLLSLCCTLAIASWLIPTPSAQARRVGINVLLNTPLTSEIVADLSAHGNVLNRYDKLNAVTMRASEDQLAAIQAKPYVITANPDAERKGSPVDPIAVSDLADGINTWNLDAINVTDFAGSARTVPQDGSGVYVAVLDTGLLDSWRQYFPEQRIATQHAIAFSGGGGEVGQVSTLPNQWEHDQNSHGTHVTSTVLGYSLDGTPVNGVAPLATVIPVKVLSQAGSGWSSVIAAGIVYVADLARGPLAGKPVVINMSLGGPRLDAIEKAAVDYAIKSGVIVVAAAGNEGEAGMTYPGAYEPVISVAASGWTGEWSSNSWWFANDVADGTVAQDFYIADFSGREKQGQDLDVTAPGSWVVGPYQYQSGKTSYYFSGGTSMASPHVAGIAALMMQKDPALRQADVERILESTAITLLPGCRDIVDPNIGQTRVCWDADATGAGLATADAALATVGGGGSAKRRK
jgi:subtilisin family serine protease